LEPARADVVATGISKPAFLVTGITFPLRHPDSSIVLLDETLSSGCYSYFIVNDHTAEIACGNPVGFKNHQERLQRTVNRFEQVLGHRIGDIKHRFSSLINFGFTGAFRHRSRCLVGEAAGFQDHLAGFGMVYAFKSGYWAARSIMGYGRYDTLWKRDFGRLLRLSCWNRLLYNRLSNQNYEDLIDVLGSRHPAIRWCRGGDDFRVIMRRVYGRSFLLLLGPLLAWKKMGQIWRRKPS
jgi:flavin-dependent dehydrogenase